MKLSQVARADLFACSSLLRDASWQQARWRTLPLCIWIGMLYLDTCPQVIAILHSLA